ncbi:MAG: class I SAM-dependent methyltransferase [Bilophila sp.]
MTPNPCVALPTLTEVAHRAVTQALLAFPESRPVHAVDATAGNGHDTVFLAGAVRAGGVVAAFDIQAEALEATRLRLENAGLEGRVRLVLAGHERMEAVLAELSLSPVAAVLFNLGFLPGSDKHTVTRRETTLQALDATTRLLVPHGILAVHMYTGHPGGLEEGQAVRDWSEALPWQSWRCLTLSQHNKRKNQEWLLLAERI